MRDEHLQDLRDPEQPDPCRHLIKILSQSRRDVLELVVIQFSALFEDVDHLWDVEATFMQTQSSRTQIGLKDILQRDIIFFVLE